MRRLMFMSRLALITLAIISLASLAEAQSPGVSLTTGNSQIGVRTSYNGEAITVAAVSIGFTSSVISPTCTNCSINTLRATAATCVLETANIRVRSDGTDPTSSVGLLITAGQQFTVYGYANIAAFRAIRTTGSSGALYCEYSRVQ